MKIDNMRKRDLIRAGFWLSLGMFIGMFILKGGFHLAVVLISIIMRASNIPV